MAGTTETIDQAGGSAATQGDLWGERARDWADVLEGWNVGYPALPAHPRTRHSRERHKGARHGLWGRGDFASQPTGALTSRARCDGDVCSDRSGPRPGGGIPCQDIEHLPGRTTRSTSSPASTHSSLLPISPRCGGEAVARPGANAITVFTAGTVRINKRIRVGWTASASAGRSR